MTGFVTKKISHRTRTLGSVLKSARAKADVTLEQVETQTRIAAKYLRALEEGRYEDLPADAYNVGFVRGYATFLKLPVDKIIRLYRQERSQSRFGSTANGMLAPRRTAEWHFFVTPKFLGAVGAILLFGGIATYIAVQLRSFASPPKLTITSLPSEFTSTRGTVQVAGETVDGVVLTMNTEAIHVAPDGTFSQDVQLQPGLNDIVVVAKSRSQKEAQQVVKVLYNPDLAKLPVSGTKE